jgi:plastocyanin
MKKLFGLCVLVIALVILSGCTQPAATQAPATPAPTTEPVTVTETAAPATTEPVVSVPATNETTAIETTAEPTLAAVPSTEITTAVPATPKPLVTKKVTTNVIHIRNNTFVPISTTVLPGTGITWINDDATTHALKATRPSGNIFSTGDIAPGSQWSYTVGATEETITFFDVSSPKVTGTIVIRNGQTLVMVTERVVPATT